jgi:regulatory protein
MAEIRRRQRDTGDSEGAERGRKRAPKPLNPPRLEELALAYVARFATSGAKLERYLQRKLRERGWDGEGEPDLPALVARFVQSGYIDDEAYARARSGSLLRRGYGPRRIGEALGEAGIEEAIRAEVRAGEAAARGAALAYARKRRFGPFGARPADPAAREKQIAAMLRAGHTLDSARNLVDASSVAAAEQWAADAEDFES